MFFVNISTGCIKTTCQDCAIVLTNKYALSICKCVIKRYEVGIFLVPVRGCVSAEHVAMRCVSVMSNGV